MPVTMGNTMTLGQNPVTRKKRTPNFPCIGKMKPFGLYPICVHPVLPGETLNSFKMKWRVLSKPVKYPLTGAWLETFLVYVKITDINTALAEMFISTSFSSSGYTRAGSANYRTFTKVGQIDWIYLALTKFHQKFFLDHSETARFIDSVPQVKLNQKSWMQNLAFRGADDPLDVTDVDRARQEMDAFQMAQMMGLSELTYEKFLGQYGVRAEEAEGMPEILRYAPSWTLPINTVEPSTGVPSTAWMWSDAVEMTKPKRFDEPGFIMMCAAIRPKLYQQYQLFSWVGNLWGFSDWFPIYNLSDPMGGVRVMSTGDDVLSTTMRTDAGEKDLYYDANDLLMHGEQFINNQDDRTTPYPIPVSTGMAANDASTKQDIRGEYCLSADVDALFSSATATDKFAIYEGLASMDISGHVSDMIA